MHMPTIRAGFDRMRHPWLIAALLCVFAFIYVQFALKIKPGDHATRSAFLRWRAQLQELDDGVNVWDKYAYPNPPIMAILLKPFLQLPPALGASLWFVCKVLFALASIIGVWTLLDSPGGADTPVCRGRQECLPHQVSAGWPFPLWAKALAALLTLRPIEGDLIHGNVNLLILVLIVVALIAICQGRDALAGVLLGLSIACKLTPALFLLYFLWKRAWITLSGAFASLIVFGLLVPAAVFGWNNNLDYLQSWHRQMVAPYAAGAVTSEHKNQSLPGVLHRLLSDEASFSEYAGDQKIVLQTHNFVAWDRGIVQGIAIAAMGLFALLAMRFCRTSFTERPRLQMLAEFSIVVLGMLLFCERTWKHHCVTLLLPFCALAYCLGTPSFSRGLRWYFGITLGLAGLLMLSTSTGAFDHQNDAHDRIGKIGQVYGAYVWAFLLLLAGMFAILRKTMEDKPKEPPCPPKPYPR